MSSRGSANRTARARSRSCALVAVMTVMSVAATACSGGDSSSSDNTPGPSTTNDVDSGSTAQAPPDVVDWTTFGFDSANSRFNPTESKLGPENVGRLEELWRMDLGSGMSTTPLVRDQMAYFGDWAGSVYAMDLDSEELVWATDLGDSGVWATPAIRGESLFVASRTSVHRVNLADGAIEWTSVASQHPIAIQPSSPVVVDDMVLQGTSSGELNVVLEDYKFRGSVTAFDIETGEERWRLWLTPDDETAGAGVGIWSTPAIDEELGLGFVGTGNTYEPPAAPLSDSIVAFDYETGEVEWSTQFTKDDAWSFGYLETGVDGDIGAGPNLWEVDGRKLVGAGDKRGDYHALDRETGDLVWETDITSGSVLGGVIGTAAMDGERIYVASNVGNPETNSPTGVSAVAALDPANGEILWRAELEGAVYAPVAASPGLVYVSTTAGLLVVLDAEDGSEVWSREVPDQSGAGASVVDGVVYWGYGFALFGSGTGLGAVVAFAPDAEGNAPGTTGTTGSPGDPVTDTTGHTAEDSVGAEKYRTLCSACHGVRGQGGIGPSFVGVSDRLTREQHLEVVTKGRPPQMPAFGEALTPEEIEAIVDYERGDLTSTG